MLQKELKTGRKTREGKSKCIYRGFALLLGSHPGKKKHLGPIVILLKFVLEKWIKEQNVSFLDFLLPNILNHVLGLEKCSSLIIETFSSPFSDLHCRKSQLHDGYRQAKLLWVPAGVRFGL